MKCAKCGSELPKVTKQCPKCGALNEFVDNQGTQHKPKPTVYIAIALGLVIALALVVTVIASMGKKNVATAPAPSPKPPTDVVTAPKPNPPEGNVVTAPQPAPAPTVPSLPSTTKPKPPADVVDYLNFVKRVEEHRQMLLKDTTDALTLAGTTQAQGLLRLIDMASDPNGKEAQDPLFEVRNELNRQYKNWLSTLEYFDKKPAPMECREFSGAYRNVLYRETMAIGTIAVSFNKVDITNPNDLQRLLSALKKMKRDPSIQRKIDEAADLADAKLTQLVSRYDMKKPFDVPREQGTSGSIMGF
jgi:hypothetical protein